METLNLSSAKAIGLKLAMLKQFESDQGRLKVRSCDRSSEVLVWMKIC